MQISSITSIVGNSIRALSAPIERRGPEEEDERETA